MKLYKYKFLFLPVVILAGLVLFATINKSTYKDKSEPDIADTEVLGKENTESNGLIEINLSNSKYKIYWFKAEPENLNLIANFKNKLPANEMFEVNKCNLGVNAGFYSKQNEPLGYFVTGYETKYKFVKNKIMNGILSVNSMDTPRITRGITSDQPKIAVQTGPFLIENDKVLNASLNNDKKARRIVAVVSSNNELFFLAITSLRSSFGGPEISELGEILTIFEKKTNINIADAINLDGGSASYFNSEENVLSEISPIGALFCEK